MAALDGLRSVDILLTLLARLEEIVEECDAKGEGVSIVVANSIGTNPRGGATPASIIFNALYTVDTAAWVLILVIRRP